MRTIYGLDAECNVIGSARFVSPWWEILTRSKTERLAYDVTFHRRARSAVAALRKMGAARVKLER